MQHPSFFLAKKMAMAALFTCILWCAGNQALLAQTAIYRSNTATGNWSAAASWQVSEDNGNTWAAAKSFPAFTNAKSIAIRNGHTITQNTHVAVAGLLVEEGATLRVTNNNTLTIEDGEGTDMLVKGTFFRSNGTVVVKGSIAFEKGGRYIHGRTGNTIPLATWDKASVIEFTAWNGTPAQFNQAFGIMELANNLSTLGANVDIEGDLILKNNNFTFNTANNQLRSVKVKGDLIAPANANWSGVQNSGSLSIEVGGNMDLSTGKFNGSNSNNGTVSIKVGGYLKAKELTGAQNNADVAIEVGEDFTITDKFTAVNGNGSATLKVGGNLHAGKNFTAAQNNNKVNMEVAGHLYGGEKMVLTNGNNNGAISLLVGGNWYAANETVVAQNNAGVNIVVKGNLYGASNKFTGVQGNGKLHMLVEGDFIQRAGEFYMAPNEGEAVLTVLHDFLFSGTRFYFTGSNGGKTPTLNVAGNMSVLSGDFEVVNGLGQVNLNGDGAVQVFTSGTNYKGNLDFNVKSGAFVQMNEGSTFIGGTGSFILESAATLGIRAAAGITTNGTTCHIKLSGRRWYDPAAIYMYNGKVAQVTGNGLVQGADVYIDNATGVTLTQHVVVSRKLYLEQGLFTTATSKLITVTNRSVDAVVGGGDNAFINGPLQWYVQNTADAYTFPVGKIADGQPRFRYCRLEEVTANGAFVAEYFPTTPPGRINNKSYSLFKDVLTGVLANEYWQIDRQQAMGKPQARVVLPYTPSLLEKKWMGVDGKSIVPDQSSKVAVAKGESDYSVWNFAMAENSYLPLSRISVALPALPHKTDGEVMSGLIDEFSPFTIGFGYFKTLPIDLTAFSALLQQQQVQLTWQIADGKTLQQFEVEHSTDGRHFSKLSTIPGHNGLSYAFAHKNPAAGINYYRLNMVEKDGSRTFSRMEMVQVGTVQTIVTGLLQNPVIGGQAMLQMHSAKNQQAGAAWVDMSGRVVLRQSLGLYAGQNQVSLSVNHLPAGNYRLLITTGDGVQKALPVVVL